ncbi:PaaI family thioesterase [Actinoplanes sp. NPDC051346]|uniref:PaaI family thioesterase n=1 Tax=Actinoplanes sp. NPDC051346 TaxID=3155048 RepID=UPI00343B7531
MDDQHADPVSREVQQRVRDSFERQGLMRLLGARLTHIAAGRVHIVLPASPEVTQQNGYIHAGATSAVADSAGGYAALTLFPQDSDVLTVEYKINLLAPAAGDHIEAIGTVLKSGRTLTISRLEVFAVQGEQRALVAAGQQTLFRIAAIGEGPMKATARILPDGPGPAR